MANTAAMPDRGSGSPGAGAMPVQQTATVGTVCRPLRPHLQQARGTSCFASQWCLVSMAGMCSDRWAYIPVSRKSQTALKKF